MTAPIGERVVTCVATSASARAGSDGGKTSTWLVASRSQDWTRGHAGSSVLSSSGKVRFGIVGRSQGARRARPARRRAIIPARPAASEPPPDRHRRCPAARRQGHRQSSGQNNEGCPRSLAAGTLLGYDGRAPVTAKE